MASESLYDAKALADELFKSILQATGLADSGLISEAAANSLRGMIETRLKESNSKYNDALALCQKTKDECESMKASFMGQINSLQKEIERLKEENKDNIQQAIADIKQDRDDVIKMADRERMEMEKQKAELERKRKESKEEIERYKREIQEALEDKREADEAWQAGDDRRKELEETIESMEKMQRDLREEIRNWEDEANKTATLREMAEAALARCRGEIEPLKGKNRELIREISQLKPQLKSAKKTIMEQEQKIRKLQVELAATNEQLDAFRARSRTPSETSGNPASLELANIAGSGPSTPRTGSAMSLTSDAGLDGYMLRKDHEEMMEEKTKEVEALQKELKRREEELRGTQEQLRSAEALIQEHDVEKDELNEDRVEAVMKYNSIKKILEERDEAQQWLVEELYESQKAKNDLQQAIEGLLEPQMNTAALSQLSNRAREVAAARQRAFNIQERLIPLALQAANDYRDVTGRGFVVHGHDRTPEGRPFINVADAFADDIRDLYNNFVARIREAREEIEKLKKSAQTNKEAQETIASMQKQIDTLTNETKDLENVLKTCQENTAKYEDPAADQDEFAKDLRQLLKQFLTVTGPSLGDLNKLLLDLVKLQKTVPSAEVFGEANQRKAQQYDALSKQLDECKEDRTKLQDRNTVLKSNFDKLEGDRNLERRRLEGEIAALTSTLQAVRDSNTQADEQGRRDLEDRFGRISAELERLRAESDEERARHAGEVDSLNSQLQTVQNRLETTRKQLTEEIRIRDADIASLQTSHDEEVKRLTGELQTARDTCNQERERLEGEVRRLTDELQTVRTASEAERARLEGEVARLTAELQTIRDNSEQERTRLEGEVTRLTAELQSAREGLAQQNDVIGNNGEQADRTQAALAEQIDVFNEAQIELIRSIENMKSQAVSQGRSAVETERVLNRAKREIDLFKGLVQELTIQRDLLQDEVRLCVEAQADGRRRLRANAAAAAAEAPAAEPGNAVAQVRATAGKRNFTVRAFRFSLNATWYIALYGTIIMAIVWTLAEAMQRAAWTDANAHTRALWMTVRDQPTVCLGLPESNHARAALALLVGGKWAPRLPWL